MSRFAAVEIKLGEHETRAIEAFFGYAHESGLKFHFLEPYGPLSVGTTSFLRFKTDCSNLDSLIPFFRTDARALILPGGSGYRLITQAAEGAIPIVRVQSAKLPGYNRRWRGTSNQFWARQFPARP